MSDIPSTGKLVIKIHDSKIYKQCEKTRAALEKVIDKSSPLYIELFEEFDKLQDEAEMISMHHANFYGLNKQFYRRMLDAGFDGEEIPKDDNGKPILFKSQVHVLDVLLKLMKTLGTYYDKKEQDVK